MTWIQTIGGRAVDLDDPKPEQIDLHDIAHALAHINRFNGHTAFPYSVAQHCVLMAQQMAPQHQPWALLHDAHEAYLGDITRPVKRLLVSGDSAVCWDDCVAALDDAIICALGVELDKDIVAAVRLADDRMLETERRFFFPRAARPWGLRCAAYELTIEPWPPEAAKVNWYDAVHARL